MARRPGVASPFDLRELVNVDPQAFGQRVALALALEARPGTWLAQRQPPLLAPRRVHYRPEVPAGAARRPADPGGDVPETGSSGPRS